MIQVPLIHEPGVGCSILFGCVVLIVELHLRISAYGMNKLQQLIDKETWKIQKKRELEIYRGTTFYSVNCEIH